MLASEIHPVVPQTEKRSSTARRPTPFVMPHEAQDWLHTRLDGLEPEDIFGGVPFVLYSVQRLKAPSPFFNVWQNMDTHHRVRGGVPSEELVLLRSAKVVLVLADLNDMVHVQDVEHLGHFLKHYYGSQSCPHVIVVQHSTKPCNHAASDETTKTELITNALRMGIDIVFEEIVGFKLAWSLQNRFKRQRIFTLTLQECVREKHLCLQNLDDMLWHVHDALWSHSRIRLGTHLPPVDLNIEPGLLRTIGGLRLGDILGGGAFSTVYKLMHNGHASGQVLKVVSKTHIKDMHEVKTIGQHVEVLILLSSKRFKHPNVAHLLGVYHSVTHIYFRLVDCGSRDLKKRLRHRDNHHSPSSSLSTRKVRSILSQVSSVIGYLHTGPEIAHLDIEPGNIIVSEVAGDIHISIADFETAIIQPSACHGVFGTFPFIAPEVFHQSAYNPFAADVWSMAVVFLEVTCCLRVVEKALHLHRLPNHAPQAAIKSHEKIMTARIRQYFSEIGAVSKLLEYYSQPTLQDMIGSLESVVPHMVQVASSTRVTSVQVAQAFFLEE